MILSGRTDVSFSADTVRKVRETAEALGYAPTAKKRPSLFDRKTVLIVCPNVLNPYYSTIVQAIQQAAADKDCDTLVYTTYRDAENEIRILNAVAGSDLAGVVFTMMPQSTELVERVNRLVPVVVIGDRNTSLNVDTVEMNNYSAGAIIAHYMIGLGHKHIAYISTTLNEANSARVRRLEGVRDTYRDECPEGSVIVRSREVTPKEERDNISIEHAVGFELTRKCLGERHITAFVDPQCGWCHKLIAEINAKPELQKDYTFDFVVVPVLGQRSEMLAKKIFCADADDAARYRALTDGARSIEALKQKDECPLEVFAQTRVIAQAVGVQGVPMVISHDGRFERGKPRDLMAFLEPKPTQNAQAQQTK